jgi:hypothetical protein
MPDIVYMALVIGSVGGICLALSAAAFVVALRK